MGLQSKSAPYRDDPQGADDAVSMHTTRSDYEYHDEAEFPSYSDSEAAELGSRGGGNRSNLADEHISNIDPYPRIYNLSQEMRFVNGKVKNDNETTIRMDQPLADPDKLEKYVQSYLSLTPPDQRIRIVGTHQETRYDQSSKKKEKSTITDFDISFSLSSGLTRERGLWTTSIVDNSDKVYRGSFYKTRAKGYRQDIELADAETLTLQDWCREYCSNKSSLKVFRVTREVLGLDTTHMHHVLERVVRSTHYHGHLGISFPIEEKNVDIYNDHWVNRWRVGWQRWIFYVTFLWLLTWPVLFFATKLYSIYNVRWSWSRVQENHERQHAGKVYASVTEEHWLESHKNLIASLVLECYQGDATHFPTDVPDERVARGVQTRLPGTGNANVDAAVSFIQGGVSAWNTLQGRGGRDSNAWGADS